MSVQAFASWVLSHTKPPTPSASTPYRQLKRLHSSQPFDETGRRTSCMSSTIRMCLFSTLDDGTGSTPAEDVLDALDFDLEGKVNLCELTVALENELLRVDRECREKDKVRSDLEKTEKLKTQLATEVDEHHSAIQRMNDLNLRKLEQEHREKLASVRSELVKEMDQIQQQAGLQREELEAEMEKIRDDETFLRDHLSLTVKESRRLEMELLDSTEKLESRRLEMELQDRTEKLVEAESQVRKLQRNLDNILKEKELQDRIDELQAELQEYHKLGRTTRPCLKPSLSEELGSKSPGMESDPDLIDNPTQDHLSLTGKESRRLEMELLDRTEKLVEAESQVRKLQRNLDNILKEKELQDRIDELQAELQEYHKLGRTTRPCLKPSLSEELGSKSPGMESDPGLGSEEGPGRCST
ncbi:unnamed protein product [Coregonus sp. 'balchen']|nr:unnamed protein product [Coregonus sp. 'balchen']